MASIIGSSALLFLIALIFALVLTPGVRAIATRVGAVDRPDGERKLHAIPIPKLGGIAIFFGFYLTALAIAPFVRGDAGAAASQLLQRSFVPSLVILLLGVADDVWGVRPATKVVVQLLAGAWICAYPELRIQALAIPIGLPSGEALGALSIPATLAWILLITNGFNIVDGIDGLASGVAFVATACLFVASLQRTDPYLPLLVAPLAGALVGFLRYNFNPATIFLGDSGSLWLGFLIAVFSLAGQYKSTTAIAIAAPLLSVALPLVETAVSTLRRFLRGEPIWKADAGHIHHQLLKIGFSARRAAIVLYAGSGLFGAASLLLSRSDSDSSRVVGGIITVTLVVFAWLGIQQLGYSEFTEVGHAFKRGFLYQRRIIQNNIVVRKLADDLRAAAGLPEAWPLVVSVANRLRFARVEFVVDAARGMRAGHDELVALGVAPWISEERVKEGNVAGWNVVSVHLMSVGHPAARIELWRARDEEPLHSELAVFVDVLTEAFPRLLRASYTLTSV